MAEGGTLPFGGPAIVGERGPEMAYLGPGSTVMPMGGDGASMQGGLAQILGRAVQGMVPGMGMGQGMGQMASLMPRLRLPQGVA